MSSLVAHAATGAAIYMAQLPPPRTRWPFIILIGLAIAPDLDYLAWWLFGFTSSPRITHTPLFCLGAALCAWFVARRLLGVAAPSLARCALAANSHLLLDLLVGVHGLPLLWPAVAQDVALPWGVLPSAGRLDLANYYLWRNLFIESAVLLPLLATAVARRRGARLSATRAHVALALLWLGCLLWSISLSR